MCSNANTTCFDPSSTNLAWMDMLGLKGRIAMPNEHQLNVILFYFVGGTSGMAVMPWNNPGVGGSQGVYGGLVSWPEGVMADWNQAGAGATLFTIALDRTGGVAPLSLCLSL